MRGRRERRREAQGAWRNSCWPRGGGGIGLGLAGHLATYQPVISRRLTSLLQPQFPRWEVGLIAPTSELLWGSHPVRDR